MASINVFDDSPPRSGRRSYGAVLWVAIVFAVAPVRPVPAQSPPDFSELSITPSDVYQHVSRVRSEIEIIRAERNALGEVRDPGRQTNRLPLHVFAKANELRLKIGRFQTTLGVSPIQPQPLPFVDVSPQNVYGNIDGILEELRLLKAFFGIERRIAEPEFVEGRTPSDVYRALWEASYAFDSLTAEITPTYVLQNAQAIAAEVELIADELGVVIAFAPTPGSGDIVPRDVIQESFVNMYLLGRLQRRLQMPPFYVPPIPGGAITPTNVYDTTLAILAELHRIKVFIGLRERTPLPPRIEETTPAEVYAYMRGVQFALREMIDAVQ